MIRVRLGQHFYPHAVLDLGAYFLTVTEPSDEGALKTVTLKLDKVELDLDELTAATLSGGLARCVDPTAGTQLVAARIGGAQ